MVVEIHRGRNLADVRSRTAQLGVRVAWAEALAVAIALGSALSHVHERTDAAGKPLEIVHRDLSPQNVMVSYDGDVKLIDFGTARGENRRCHTISGIVFAKPGYVAPEVANNHPGGVPADLCAFGVMLWELIAGRRFLVGEAAVHLAAVGAGRRVPSPIAQAAGPARARLGDREAHRHEHRGSLRFCARRASGDRAPAPARAEPGRRRSQRARAHRAPHAPPVSLRADPLTRGVRAPRGRRAGAPAAEADLARLSGASAAEPVDESLLPGTRYRIESELGRGASGVVYKCVHLDLGRQVALKVLHETGDALSLEGFRAEARAIASLDHPHLVRL